MFVSPCRHGRWQVELPRWVGETAEAPRLVEAEPGICEGLVQFCLAEAQQMAIGKASVISFQIARI